VLVLDMIEILPPLGKYKYDTWRIFSVKCYTDNSVCLWSYIGRYLDWYAPKEWYISYGVDQAERAVEGIR
jgi:hypothetical protein